MKKSTKITIATILVLGVTTGVYAVSSNNHWNMSPEEKSEFITDRISNKLELDASQQQSLQDLASTMMNIMGDVRSSHREHMEVVQQLLAEPTLDQAQALEMIRQKTQMINDKAPQVIASLAGFMDTLNEDQRTQLRGFIGERMEHHGRH